MKKKYTINVAGLSTPARGGVYSKTSILQAQTVSAAHVDGRVAVQMQHGSLEITHSTTHSIMADVPFYIILSEYVMMGETGPFVDGVTDADAVPAHWVDIGYVDGSLASPEAQEKDKNTTFDVCKRPFWKMMMEWQNRQSGGADTYKWHWPSIQDASRFSRGCDGDGCLHCFHCTTSQPSRR